MNFILYGIKDDNKYFISSFDPLSWTTSPLEAKKYSNRYNAEYDVLKVYDNYKILKENISKGILDNVFIAEIILDVTSRNINETWRLKLI